MNNNESRNELVQNLLSRHGIYVGITGSTGIKINPSLVADASFIEMLFSALKLEFEE